MKKKIIVAAVAAAVAAPFAAMADATVYGKVRVATVAHDRDSPASDSWALEDESSRLGIKGSEDLGNGLKAIYKMEFGVQVGNAFGSLSGRNAYVGLAGDWGTALVGRHDTPMKMSTGKLDLFQDTTADADNGGTHIGLFDDNRFDEGIMYISPTFSGFNFAAMAIQNHDTDDFADAYSLAATFNQGPWFASLAYEEIDSDSQYNAGSEDDTKWRIGLGVLGMSGFSVTGAWESRDDTNGVDGADSDAWYIQAAYDFGNNRVKGMYGDFDGDGGLEDFDSWAIGLQHNFSKRTDVQLIYRAKDMDVSGDDNTFALQLNHSF